MVEVVVEQRFESPVARQAIERLRRCGCLELFNVNWRRSYFATDGCRVVSHFDAPDAESVRLVFRKSGQAVETVWAATSTERG